MRFNEFNISDPVEELAKKLPTLKKTDYDAIDRLMKRISFRHKLKPKKLHDLFVHKYGHTPDHWIKKMKNPLGETNTDPTDDDDSLGYLKYFAKPQEPKKPEQQKMYHGWEEYEKERAVKQPEKVKEAVETDEDFQKIQEFIKWCYKTLHVQKPYPKITLSRDTNQAQKDHRTGVHKEDGTIEIYIGDRNLVDIFRTIFHELVHERQSQLGMIKDGDSYPGSPIEAMADMLAGKYIKIYGKQHPEIFQ